MQLQRILAPRLRARLVRSAMKEALPVPTDEPRASASGPDPLRVLVVGGGPASGWGVTSHALGLPGHLARTLAVRLGRGVDVVLSTDAMLNVEEARLRLAALPLERYDALVITLGLTDALELLPVDRWRQRLDAVLATVRDGHSGLPTLVVGVLPAAALPVLGRTSAAVTRGRADSFDVATRYLLASSDNTEFVRLRGDVLVPGRGPTAESYRAWASDISAALVPLLSEAEQIRQRPAAVPIDARLTTRTAVELREAHSAELDRLVDIARTSFGVAHAAISLVDGDSVWYRDAPDLPMRMVPRANAICASTVEHSGGLVIEDLSQDERFRDEPLVIAHSVAFYAGYPIESEDGTPIGVLCLFDTVPHAREDLDLALLRDMALLAQRELGALARQSGSRRPGPQL